MSTRCKKSLRAFSTVAAEIAPKLRAALHAESQRMNLADRMNREQARSTAATKKWEKDNPGFVKDPVADVAAKRMVIAAHLETQRMLASMTSNSEKISAGILPIGRLRTSASEPGCWVSPTRALQSRSWTICGAY
jgi:hypothetical protein